MAHLTVSAVKKWDNCVLCALYSHAKGEKEILLENQKKTWP